MRFLGKSVLVTGGGTGIGAEVARQMASEGARVAVMGRRPEPLRLVADEIGGLSVPADASDPSQVQNALQDVKRENGPLDILICVAGGGGVGAVGDISDEDWKAGLGSTLESAFVCARACLPDLIERKGNIVLVSSAAGRFAVPGAAGYVTMKHAVIGLARSIARDYGPKGIRCNVVSPGWVATENADLAVGHLVQTRGLDTLEEAYRLVTKDVPLRRPAQPIEIAKVICFLASEDAAMITGAELVVDGGAAAVDLPTIAFGPDQN